MNRGSIIDLAVKEQAKHTFGLGSLTYTGRGYYGADIFNAKTMRGWDITTPGQWPTKISKYVTDPAPGRTPLKTLDPLFTQ